MRSLSLRTHLVLFAFAAMVAGPALGGESCAKEKLATASTKVSELLAGWTAWSAEASKLCPDRRAELETRLANIASSCPVGSRMGETLAFVEGKLAAALEAEKACAEACAAKKEGKDAAGCAASEAMARRSKLLGDLHALVSHAIGAETSSCGKKAGTDVAAAAKSCDKKGEALAAAAKSCDKKGEALAAADFCAKKAETLATAIRGEACKKSAASLLTAQIPGLSCDKKAASLVASIKAAGCDKSAAKVVLAAADQSASCARLARLKASWDEGAKALASFCPDKRKELDTEFAALSQEHGAVKLFPGTMDALSSGLAALAQLDEELAAYAKAHPEVAESVPAAAHESWARSVSSVRQAHELISHVMGVLQKAHSTDAGEKVAAAE